MDEYTVARLKALADPVRLGIVRQLAGRGEVCVCELLAVLGTSQPNISAHLRVLRAAGLIRARRAGKWVHYRLEQPQLAELAAELQALATQVGAPAACCGTVAEELCHVA